MQCVHFKGTKCVFDRGNAVTTCSKWPDLQITLSEKTSHMYCVDWPSGLRKKREGEKKRQIQQSVIGQYT